MSLKAKFDDASAEALLLSALKGTRILEKGRKLHTEAVQHGRDSNIYVASALINMYGRCGSMVEARRVFDCLKQPDVVSWNVLILGYAVNGQGHTALDLFHEMKCAPSPITMVAALKACTSLAVKGGACGRVECREWGTVIENKAFKNGFFPDFYLESALIDVYAKCGSMTDAQRVFDSMENPNVVSWTALILGYAESGKCLAALDLFTIMKVTGPAPNSVTFLAVLKACTSVSVEEESSKWGDSRRRGRAVHNLALHNGCESDIKVQSSLIDMYAKCGSMEEAHFVFDMMRHPDVVAWSALILGYSDNGEGVRALGLFTRMKSEGPAPNSVTYMAALKACSLVGGLDFGRKVHSEIDVLDVNLVSSLVDFYSSCGSLVDARSLFDLHIETADVVSWNAMLAGLSSSGDCQSACRLFEQMQDRGVRPNSSTFVCILMCCSHGGLVETAEELFDTMFSTYGITPLIDHYNCMADVFGRANRLEDAMALLQRMPCSPDYATWVTILSACRKWKHVELGRLAFWCLIQLNDMDPAAGYVLLEQTYEFG